ncbi:MAG: lipoprotein insertase outer membrane protein LolB [Legionella sp.]|uniref:lipoprotein insertase outer membrane protein LolB n=1 Tax=Legionella sp. TaxID=459 RepID=UPI0039E3D306
MDNLKRFIIIPICLLTACTTTRPVMDQQTQQSLEKQPLLKQPLLKQSEPTTANKVTPGEQHKGQANTVSSWQIRGGMAAKNKSKGWSASMNWVQNGPSSYHIRLMGPLGAGTVLIDKKGSTISYQDGPKRITSNNAEELLQRQTGVRLPVNNLYYWVRGLPAPGKVSSEQRDQNNNLVQLRQSGYTITFGNYTSVKGIALPGIVRLDGDGLMVKVMIKNWSI